MHNTLLLATAALTLTLAAAQAPSRPENVAAGDWIQLFNGRDLSDWTIKFAKHELGENLHNTFRVEDGLLQVRYDGWPSFNGEFGHIFYKDRFYGHDDALYVAVRLLSILASGRRSLAELHDAMPPSFSTPEVRFDCEEERKFKAMAEVRANLAADGAELVDIDGVRVREADGWWLLRASNTQAVLVARAEARDEAGLDRLKSSLARHLELSGVKLPKESQAAH